MKQKIIKYIFYTFSLLIFFLNHSFIYSDSDECKYKDCYNCTYCGNITNTKCICSWDNDNSKCAKLANNPLDKWYNELSSCTTNTEQFKYCAEVDKRLSLDGYITYSLNDFSENEMAIELPERYGKYGTYNFVCSYKYFDNTYSEMTYNIEIKFLLDNTTTSLELPSIIYATSSGTSNIIEISESTTLKCEKCTNFIFAIFLKGSYPSSPFYISVTLDRSDTMKYLSLCSILIVILIVIGIVICCISRYSNKKAREQLRLLMIQRARENMTIIQRENNELNFKECHEDLEEKNKQKLDTLFQTTMAEHFYKTEYNQYGGGCSICLENFKKKSKVAITPCKHVFHFKCIKDWLYKNAKNPKCPNCNIDVLEYKPEIQENEKKENENNNNENVNKVDDVNNDINQLSPRKVKVKKKKKDKGGNNGNIEIYRPQFDGNVNDNQSSNNQVINNRMSKRIFGLRDSSQTGRELNV